MNKKKKISLGIVMVLIIFGTVGVVIGTNDTIENNVSTIAENEEVVNTIKESDFRIKELRQNGILIGDEEGNLNLDKTLKRQEMVVLISRLMGKEEEAKNWNTRNLTFEDVGKDNWAAGYIAWAKDNNITKGYSDEWFGYNDSLTLTQTQIFLLRVLGYSEVDMDSAEHLAYTSGLMNRINNEENSEIIRSDVAIMLYNALYIEDEEQNTLANKLGIEATLTAEEKGLTDNMGYYNVEFLRMLEVEGWAFIYIDSTKSTLGEKEEEEYKAFIHSIISVIGYKNMKIMDTTNELEIIAYCDAENLQVLALEVDGVYNYFNMKESF